LDVEFGRAATDPGRSHAPFGSISQTCVTALELVDVADQLKDVDFKVFAGPANDRSAAADRLARAEAGRAMPLKQIDDYTKFVGIYGAKGSTSRSKQAHNGVEGFAVANR
jgi:aspartyl-tRNA synthetase